jgi:hypothetical protein
VIIRWWSTKKGTLRLAVFTDIVPDQSLSKVRYFSIQCFLSDDSLRDLRAAPSPRAWMIGGTIFCRFTVCPFWCFIPRDLSHHIRLMKTVPDQKIFFFFFSFSFFQTIDSPRPLFDCQSQSWRRQNIQATLFIWFDFSIPRGKFGRHLWCLAPFCSSSSF